MPTDERAVRELYARLIDAWNRGNADDFASVFADDAVFIAFDGSRQQGRRAIHDAHVPLFEKYMKGTRLVGEVTDVTFLGPDAAVAHATGSTIARGKTKPSPERDSIQTLVAARRGGEWRLVAFHNTRVRPIGKRLPETLFWLVGDKLWRLVAGKGPRLHLAGSKA